MTRISLDGLNVNILTYDIETRPGVAYHFDRWDVNISTEQVIERTGLLCLAAKWYDRKGIVFHSEWDDGHDGMVRAAWDLLDRADIVVTYNGDKFDNLRMMGEFALAGLPPPKPFRSVDLFKVAKKMHFDSRKLDEVADVLGCGRKVKHHGFRLWREVLEGDPKARALMRRYNIADTRLTELVYDRLRPYMAGHVPLSLFGADQQICPACGSPDVEPAGWHRTSLTMYAAYRCQACGLVSRTAHSKQRAGLRGAQ